MPPTVESMAKFKQAGAIVVRAGKTGPRILLVTARRNPNNWIFPKGHVESGETLKKAAVREAREEAGLDVRLDHLINVYSYPGRAPVVIVYAASIVGGTLAVDDEGLEARFFEPHEIPWGELAFPSTHDGLREYLASLLAGSKQER